MWDSFGKFSLFCGGVADLSLLLSRICFGGFLFSRTSMFYNIDYKNIRIYLNSPPPLPPPPRLIGLTHTKEAYCNIPPSPPSVISLPPPPPPNKVPPSIPPSIHPLWPWSMRHSRLRHVGWMHEEHARLQFRQKKIWVIH